MSESNNAPALEQTNDRYEFLYQSLFDFPRFELSVSAENALRNDGIYFIGDLLRKTEEMLRWTPNIGRKLLAEIKTSITSLQPGLLLGCLTADEQLEFDARNWLNRNQGCVLFLRCEQTQWEAPAWLVKELHQLGITQRTELATCPKEVLVPFFNFRGDLERMLVSHYDARKKYLGLLVPRHLNAYVRVYKPVVGEKSPESTE